jgi:hypothetical protein
MNEQPCANQTEKRDKRKCQKNDLPRFHIYSLLSQLAENSARHRDKHSIIHPLASCAEGRLAIRKCCC